MISDDGVPEADDDNALNTPEIFDLCINVEIGIPSGNDG